MGDQLDRLMARMTLRSLMSGATAALAEDRGFGNGFERVLSVQAFHGRCALVLDANNRLAQTYFDETSTARKFPPSSVQSLSVNGNGRPRRRSRANWRFELRRPA